MYTMSHGNKLKVDCCFVTGTSNKSLSSFSGSEITWYNYYYYYYNNKAVLVPHLRATTRKHTMKNEDAALCLKE